MTTTADQEHEEYLAAAEQALGGVPGVDALEALGWWELLDALDDADTRRAALVLFRAQGRTLSDSPAIGALLAQPYAQLLDHDGRMVAALPDPTGRKGAPALLVGVVTASAVLVDRPGAGALLFAPEAVQLEPVALNGRLTLHRVRCDPADASARLAEADAVDARRRATFRARVALAAEMLGAAEGALALASTHACDREQFGQPIARFQAVRHLLAWGSADCRATADVVDAAVTLDDRAPTGYDEIAKALSGRNGRRVCELSLQVLGGIGFTAEHEHHHHHSRVLALDALLGSSAGLTHALGVRTRTEGLDPALTRAQILHTS